jgi:Zn finger protein HypA/HybF involved in hydrogenase expression
MHEFTAVKRVIDEIKRMQPRPDKVRITLGKMMGTAKGFEDMFREHTHGTPLQGIGIEIVQKDVNINCPHCGFEGTFRVVEHIHFVRCPMCGKVADIITGNELKVERVN